MLQMKILLALTSQLLTWVWPLRKVSGDTSMQKIYVTLVMQYLDQEFWEKLMSFWLLHVSSSCAWKAAPSAVEEEPGRVAWRFFPSCGGWAGAGAHPAFPCSRGKLGRPEAAGRPRWMWAEGKGGDSSKTEWFSELLLSPQQCRWVLLMLCFSLLLTCGRLCLPWVTALGVRPQERCGCLRVPQVGVSRSLLSSLKAKPLFPALCE